MMTGQTKTKKVLALLVALIMMLGMVSATMPVMAENSEITLPDLISDNALFQREKPIKIWGTAIAQKDVAIKLMDGENVISSAFATADESGTFDAELPATEAGGPYELKVSCDNVEKTVSNILIGELWFLSGQSNMETKVKYAADPYKTEMLNSINKNDDIRLFIRSYNWDGALKTDEPQSDLDGEWVTVTKANVENYSSVGWSAMKELYDNLGGCPVGGIESSASGSKMASFRKEKGDGTFNKIIAPVTNMNIRGMFWYQGEGDKDNENFAEDFKNLVTEYRTEWNNPNMPVIYVQLAASPKLILTDEANVGQDFTNVRYSQLQALYNIDGTVGMINAADRTLPNTTDLSTIIHYSDKQVVGQRLAHTAANLVYGIKGEFLAPTYTGYTVENEKITVNFANAYSGLTTSDGKAVRGFTVAGEDGVYKKADARISADKNSVILTSDEVAAPKNFRYCDDTTLSGVQYDGENYVNPNLVNSVGNAALACESAVTDVKEIKPAYSMPIQDFNYEIGSEAILPSTVTLTAANGTNVEKNVTWNTSIDTVAEKHFTIFGTVEDTDVLAVANVNVMKNTDFSVAQTVPNDKEQNVSLNKIVKIKFNQPLNSASVTDENVTVKANGASLDKTMSYDIVQRTIEIDFSKLAGTKYTVTVSKNITDENGNALNNEFSFSFITDSAYYCEDFENIEDSSLSANAGSGYYKISDLAKIHKGNNQAEIADNALQMTIMNGGLIQYSINNGIEIKDRTVVSYDITRYDTNAHLGVSLLLNDTTNSKIESAAVKWRGQNAQNIIDGTNTSYEKGTHHFEIVLDPFMKKGYSYIDGSALQEYDLSDVTDWKLTRINLNTWGQTEGTTESVVDIDNIKVAKYIYETDVPEGEAAIYPADGAVVNNNTETYVDFGSAVNVQTLSNIKVTDLSGNEIEYTGKYDGAGRYYITFEKAVSQKYTITVANVTDVYGEAIKNISSTFEVAYYFEDFENILDPELTENAGNGYYKISDSAKIHKGSNQAKIIDNALRMTMNGGLIQYSINNGIELKDRTVVSYDITRYDTNASLGITLYLNDKTNSNIGSADVKWRGQNNQNIIDGTNTSYEKGTHHFEIVLDPSAKKGYLNIDENYIKEYDLSDVTDWKLSRIVLNTWSQTSGTTESVVDVDNIAVYKLNTELSDEDVHSSLSDKQESVGVNEVITLSFGKEILPNALDGKISLTTGGENVIYTGSYDIMANTYTILPVTAPNTVYTLKVSDLTAADNTTLAGTVVRFKTGLYEQNFDNINELTFTDNEANLNGTNIKIHKGNSDVQVIADDSGKYLNMEMGKACQVQYTISDIISGIKNNKVVVGYDLYIDEMVQSFNQKVLFGGRENINNDNYSLEFEITPEGSIGVYQNSKYQSEKDIIKTGWNNIKLVFDFDKLSASVYVNDQKAVSDFSILDIKPNISADKCTGIGKIVFHTWTGDENQKHNYKIDNINVKTINAIEVDSALKNSENTVTNLTGITDTKDLKATFDIKNNGFENSDDLMVTMAIYSDDGTLKAVALRILSGVEASYHYSCEDFGFKEAIEVKDGDIIKLFAWKNGTNIPILMPSITK